MERPTLVGILNVTPDSFSDGGDFIKIEKAVVHAMKMVDAGAAIIDVGGESTRPGALRVSAEDQIQRIIPVIKMIHQKSDVIISVDTTRASVASEAIEAGASIINDVSAGVEDEDIFTLARTTGVGIVLMHRRLPPEQDAYSDQYVNEPKSVDIMKEVGDWLIGRTSIAIDHGIPRHAIAIDPGLGFGRSVAQNWELMEHVDRLVDLGYPVYVGLSRKSFIGAKTEIEDPKSRDETSASTALTMSNKGVQIFRVHNVPLHARVLQSALLNEQNDRS